MWQLICDHRYQWADIAADRSPWGSNGISSGVTPLADVSALRFSSAASQIAIPRRPSDPWGSLDAIGVEVTARFLAQASGTLIDADHSFRVSSDNGDLTGDVSGRSLSISIPADRWVRLTFRHDGFNALAVGYSTLGPGPGSAGGTATRIPHGLVPPVGAKGILIGNRIGASARHMRGDIASVRVWRRDPASMAMQFLARPLDSALAACWAQFLRELNRALRDNPKCAEWIAQLISGLQRNFLDKLAQKSDDKITEFREMCRQYRDLWFGGHVDSPQMQALLARMRNWLAAENLISNADLLELFGDPCLATLTDALPSLECDPQLKRLIEVLNAPPMVSTA